MADTRDLKSLGGNAVRVQAPSPVPRRSKVRFAPTSFMPTAKKTPSARSLAPPFQTATAGAGLRFGFLNAHGYLFCQHNPRRSKLRIACSDFFQTSERARFAAPPFKIEPTSLGFNFAWFEFISVNAIRTPAPRRSEPRIVRDGVFSYRINAIAHSLHRSSHFEIEPAALGSQLIAAAKHMLCGDSAFSTVFPMARWRRRAAYSGSDGPLFLDGVKRPSQEGLFTLCGQRAYFFRARAFSIPARTPAASTPYLARSCL